MTRITVITAATAAATAATTIIITIKQKNATKNNDLAEKNAYGKVENALHRQRKNRIELCIIASGRASKRSKPIFNTFNLLFALLFFWWILYLFSFLVAPILALVYICSVTRFSHAVHTSLCLAMLLLLPFARLSLWFSDISFFVSICICHMHIKAQISMHMHSGLAIDHICDSARFIALRYAFDISMAQSKVSIVVYRLPDIYVCCAMLCRCASGHATDWLSK